MKLLIAFLLVAARAAVGQGGPLAITHVTVVNVETGARLPDHTVVVEARRIVTVGPSPEVVVPSGATVVDGAGKYLIPGLWDMHAHVLNRWSWTAPLAVAAGVTGVRDMASWGPLAEAHRIRAEVAAGSVVGPRVASFAGPLVDGEPAIFDEYLAVGTEARARAVVDSLADAGVDLIKVYTRLPRDLFASILERARERGLPVAGHVPLALTTAEASDMGMWSVEHAYRHRLACAEAEDEIRHALIRQIAAQEGRDWESYDAIEDSTFRLGIETYSPDRCRELGRRFARNGTWFVPTLVEMRSRFRPEDHFSPSFDSLFTQPWLRAVPRRLVARWRDEMVFQIGLRAGMAPSEAAWEDGKRARAQEIDTRLRMVADMQRGGAGILAGTDGAVAFPLVVSGYSIHEELSLFVQAGLSPAEALRTATLNPARALGLADDLGSVAVGKMADLVLLAADPLEDIANTTRIDAVILDGRLFDRQALDALWEEAAAAAAASD
jgi:imidazolonepropionase-like amidohydrolase